MHHRIKNGKRWVLLQKNFKNQTLQKAKQLQQSLCGFDAA